MTNQKKLALVGALQYDCLAKDIIKNPSNSRKAAKQNLQVSFLLQGLLKQLVWKS
jgi:hypothetical protein